MKKKDNTLVQSVQRAIMVLESVAKEKEGVGVTELTGKTGLDKSTTFRMLHTLEYCGYLSQDQKTRLIWE